MPPICLKERLVFPNAQRSAAGCEDRKIIQMVFMFLCLLVRRSFSIMLCCSLLDGSFFMLQSCCADSTTRTWDQIREALSLHTGDELELPCASILLVLGGVLDEAFTIHLVGALRFPPPILPSLPSTFCCDG